MDDLARLLAIATDHSYGIRSLGQGPNLGVSFGQSWGSDERSAVQPPRCSCHHGIFSARHGTSVFRQVVCGDQCPESPSSGP